MLSFFHSPALTSIHDHWKNHSFGVTCQNRGSRQSASPAQSSFKEECEYTAQGPHVPRELSQQESLPRSPGPRPAIDEGGPCLCEQSHLHFPTQLGLGLHVLENVRSIPNREIETQNFSDPRATTANWSPCQPPVLHKRRDDMVADLLLETF